MATKIEFAHGSVRPEEMTEWRHQLLDAAMERLIEVLAKHDHVTRVRKTNGDRGTATALVEMVGGQKRALVSIITMGFDNVVRPEPLTCLFYCNDLRALLAVKAVLEPIVEPMFLPSLAIHVMTPLILGG